MHTVVNPFSELPPRTLDLENSRIPTEPIIGKNYSAALMANQINISSASYVPAPTPAQLQTQVWSSTPTPDAWNAPARVWSLGPPQTSTAPAPWAPPPPQARTWVAPTWTSAQPQVWNPAPAWTPAQARTWVAPPQGWSSTPALGALVSYQTNATALPASIPGASASPQTHLPTQIVYVENTMLTSQLREELVMANRTISHAEESKKQLETLANSNIIQANLDTRFAEARADATQREARARVEATQREARARVEATQREARARVAEQRIRAEAAETRAVAAERENRAAQAANERARADAEREARARVEAANERARADAERVARPIARAAAENERVARAAAEPEVQAQDSTSSGFSNLLSWLNLTPHQVAEQPQPAAAAPNPVNVAESHPWHAGISSFFSEAWDKTKQAAEIVQLQIELAAETARADAERARAEAERAARLAAETEQARAQAEAQALAAETARADNATRDAETARAEAARAAETARAAAENERAARAAETAQAAENERAARAAEAEQARLAAETARAAEAALAAETARADKAEQVIARLRAVIDEIKLDFDNLKQDFTSLLQPQTTPTRPINFTFTQGTKKENYALKWVIDHSALKEEASSGEYNIYLKFTAFSGSTGDDDTPEKQQASTQIALLKLKLINYGMKNSGLDLNDGDFKNNDIIIKMLQEVENRGVTNNTLNRSDDETLTYCKEFVSLGQQCKRIEDDIDNKDNIFERVAHEFKKGLIAFSCKDVRKYRVLSGEELITEITTLSDAKIEDIENNKNKIILLNALLIPLTEACIGREKIAEIQNTKTVLPDRQEEIIPEVAKVFVELDEARSKSIFSKLQPNQQTKLIELIKEEAEYSESVQRKALGDFHFFLKNEFLNDFVGGMFRFTTRHRSKAKSKDEVLDFFKKREAKCKEILKEVNYKITPQPDDTSLNLTDGDKIKVNPIQGIMDLFDSIKKKIEEVSKKATDRGVEAEELLPETVLDSEGEVGRIEAAGVEKWRGRPPLTGERLPDAIHPNSAESPRSATATATAHAAAAPATLSSNAPAN
jgi:hypothetical protein